MAVEATLLAVGDTSHTYAVVYASFTGLVLLAALCIVWEAISAYTYKLRRLSLFALTAIVLTRFVFVGIHRQLQFSDWIVLSEGTVLYTCGFALACVSFFSGRKCDIYFILAILWMSQAGFFWAWLLSLPEAIWVLAGWYVPTALVTLGFVLCGLCLNPSRNAPNLRD